MTAQNGSSMYPLIHSSDKPIIEKAKNVKLNDILAFRKNGKIIAHRVVYVGRNTNSFILKGDNNQKSDGIISKKNILGKITSVKRGKKKVLISDLYLSQSYSYLEELKKINNAFKANSLRYILLKGLPLYLFVNNSPPQKLYFDADILVEKKDFKKAQNILRTLNFKLRKPNLFGKKIEEISQVSLVNKKKPYPVVVDLHSEPAFGFTKVKSLNFLLPEIKLITNYLFENIRQITINKEKYPMLKRDALTLYLLLHFFHHNFKGANSMHLICSVVKKENVSINKVAKIAKKLNLLSFIFPPLLFLKKYYFLPKSLELEKFSISFPRKVFSKILVAVTDPFSQKSQAQEGVYRLLLLSVLSDKSILYRVKLLLSKESVKFFLPTLKSVIFNALRS